MVDDSNKSRIGKECFKVVLFFLLTVVLLPQFVDLLLTPKEELSSEVLSIFYKKILIQIVITIPVVLGVYERRRSVENVLFAVGLPQLISIYSFGGSILTSLVCTIALVGLYLAIYFAPIFWEKKLRRKDPFEELNVEQRLIVLRRVLLHEKKRLGIDMNVKLVSKSMLADTLAGCYPATGVVEINKFNLSKERPDALDLTLSIVHEAKHLQQYAFVVSANGSKISQMSSDERILLKKMRHNFTHYKSAEVDGKAYENQLIEKQARAYAKERKPYYRKHLKAIIESCLNQSLTTPKGKATVPKKIQSSRVA